MMIVVNGEEIDIAGCPTLADLVEHFGLGDRAVAVELNRELIPRDRHAETRLRKGDRIELVTLVGGG
ncbi:MAG: sulfur carrier protein ThiS [Phycisphaerales bacterium]|nr:sulfur carrier protein ThiS [Phycisphaerales bacterium]